MIKKIYNILPVSIQDLLISLYGYKLNRERFSGNFYQLLNVYKNKSYDNLEKEKNNQLIELKKLIKYAKKNSPFYAEFYKNISLDDIDSLEDIKKLPILEKEVLRENIEKVYTISEKEGIVSFTGGTTGKSLKVIYKKEDFQKRQAYLWAFKEKLGIKLGMKMATFSGRELLGKNSRRNIFWRYNSATKQKLYSTFHLQEKNLKYYVEDLNKFKPDSLNGFVSAIYELAKYINDNNLKLNFTPKAIFTTSETLLEYHREEIEKVFHCKIYNQYASSEGAPFITECKEGKLHYNMDTGIIEEYKTEYGIEMLVTSFTSYGTPLIRYRIGDKIEFSDEKNCKCGNCHPIVKKIEGRQVDFLYSKEKGKVSLSHLADTIKGLPNCIKKMKFIQNDLNKIIIKLVVDKEKYNEKAEKSIIEHMEYRFGKSMKFEIQIVDELYHEKSGKYKLIECSLKN